MKMLIILFPFLLFASIQSAQKDLKNTTLQIKRMNQKLYFLAKKIINQQKVIKKLDLKIRELKKSNNKLKTELQKSSKVFQQLTINATLLNNKKEKIENEIIHFISQNYYLDTKENSSLKDLIFTELNEEILKQYSNKIQAFLGDYKKINSILQVTNQKIRAILKQKSLLDKKTQELNKLKNQKLLELENLKRKKELYYLKLSKMKKRQQQIRKKLKDLKILKRTNNIKVKKVGSSYLRPKVTVYKGKKTIPPVYGKVIKHFGSYIDPIYKIKIYNDSITIQTKPNSLVKSILSGRVVYIGESEGKNIVFIKHKHNLFSIYANLIKVSPILKKGSYIKKGQIVGRVKNSLEFEVTYKDMAIDPLEVINLK
jgi:murein DD-endopeptidase MepM/ murein hydrolase activator NlpD